MENTITSIRLKKFRIGHFNETLKRCTDSWLEIHETNSNVNEYKSSTARTGKFCGKLLNFRNTHYSSSKHITLDYVKSNAQLNETDEFEFEVFFYKKDAKSLIVEKNIFHSSVTSLDYGHSSYQTSRLCDRVFTNCNNQPCAISSPGYPGIFLKNLNCIYRIENLRKGDKIILVSDNLQLDGKLCHYNHSSNSHLSSSFFCDSGTRRDKDCMDTVSIQDGFVSNVCGIGRMNKVVTNKRSLTIQFTSGAHGYFANTGFLFYAVSQREYLENYAKYHSPKLMHKRKDLHAVMQIDKLLLKW